MVPALNRVEPAIGSEPVSMAIGCSAASKRGEGLLLTIEIVKAPDLLAASQAAKKT